MKRAFHNGQAMRLILVASASLALLAASPAWAGLHEDHAQETLDGTCPAPILLGPCHVSIRHDVYRNICYTNGCWVHQDCHGTAEAQGDPTWTAAFSCTNLFTATETCPKDTSEQLNGVCTRDWRTYNGAGVFVDKGSFQDFHLSGSVASILTGGGASTGTSDIRAEVHDDGTLHIFLI